MTKDATKTEGHDKDNKLLHMFHQNTRIVGWDLWIKTPWQKRSGVPHERTKRKTEGQCPLPNKAKTAKTTSRSAVTWALKTT